MPESLRLNAPPAWNTPTAAVPNLPADRPLLTLGQFWRGNGGRWAR